MIAQGMMKIFPGRYFEAYIADQLGIPILFTRSVVIAYECKALDCIFQPLTKEKSPSHLEENGSATINLCTTKACTMV